MCIIWGTGSISFLRDRGVLDKIEIIMTIIAQVASMFSWPEGEWQYGLWRNDTIFLSD